ncbi:NUDIX hydrolase [Arthrobacter sp. HLT1-21]
MGHISNRLFPVPEDQLDAARSWVEHGERTPVKPRSASSVVLIRDAPAGTETYLSYRRGESPLGIVAFPGGSIEESDDDDVAWFGPAPAQWAKAMGIDDVFAARRHVVGAIRELFEETGVLLAGPDAASLVDGSRNPEWMKAREDIATQERSFSEILTRRGLGIRTDLLKPLAHWLSPDYAHRRFDTHYFAAAQPTSQEASVLGSKGIWGEWRCAAREVARAETTALGDEVGQPNSVGRTLDEIAVPAVELMLEKIGSSKGCVAYLTHKRPMKVYYPHLVTPSEEADPMLEVACSVATEGGSGQRGR